MTDRTSGEAMWSLDGIVGREAELAAIARSVDDPSRPRALLIEGEAGIGKTTLWRAALARARRRGDRVLEASPAGSETVFSFAAVGDLLADVVEEVLDRLPAPRREALSIALLRAESTGPPDQRALAFAMLNALQALAAERRLTLAVDDVQWLDPESARILEFSARRLRGEPVFFCLARRAERPGGQLPLGLGRTAVPAERIDVPPLSLGALQRLLHERLGATFPRRVLRRVHAAAGGNPFYGLELGRAFLRHGLDAGPDEPLPLPELLRGLVEERLGELSDRTRRALGALALAGGPAADRMDAEALEPALATGVVELAAGRYRFAHPLLAEAVRANLSPERRRRLHAELASVASSAEERARHHALATAEQDATVAAELEAAAAGALGRGAIDTAAELADLAVRVTPAEMSDDLRRRRRGAAECFAYAGDLPRARSALEQVVAELPPGPERAGALLGIAETCTADWSKALAICDRALAEAGGDAASVAAANRFAAMLWVVLGRADPALEHAQAAVAAFERTTDTERLMHALAAAALLERYTARLGGGLLERGLELERTLVRPGLQGAPTAAFYSSPRSVLALRLLHEHRLDEARPLLETARGAAIERGDEPSLASALLHLTELECRAGNWAEADDLADAMAEVTESRPAPGTRSSARYARALVDAHLGRVEAVRAAVADGLAAAEEAQSTFFRYQHSAVLGFLELSLGDAAAAWRVLGPLADELEDGGWRDPGLFQVLPNAVEAALAVDERREAERLSARLDDQAAAVDNRWALAVAARCGGLLAAAAGDEDDALARLAEAIERHERITGPFDLGRTLLSLGSVERRAKRRAAAHATLGRALATFEGLGARLWAERARAELGRIGGRGPATGGLTPSERQVATLVAAGLTTREVAARLVLSPKTVEGHLGRVYQKLQVRTRAQLARHPELVEADEVDE